MRPTNDDKDAVAVRYNKKKSKSTEKSNVNFEPEKYEAALRSILGMVFINLLTITIFFYYGYYFQILKYPKTIGTSLTVLIWIHMVVIVKIQFLVINYFCQQL